jgi:hypothetical protein
MFSLDGFSVFSLDCSLDVLSMFSLGVLSRCSLSVFSLDVSLFSLFFLVSRLVGPSGGGKTQIFGVLRDALSAKRDVQYREQRINPKAIRAAEMYGEVDPLSQEWTTGVFAAIWEKSNRRENPYDTWIVADGPVDAIWIEGE